jgi:hypothetical protein
MGLLLASCQEEPTSMESSEQTEVQETETSNTTVEDVHQSNVVTPEFWSSFDTDVKMVFFYSKVEGASEQIQVIKQDLLLGETNGIGYEFHEYHTDENMGMVMVDDNIFFNLTEYLWNNEQGFVLLKKGGLLHIPANEVNEQTFVEIIEPFFVD